MSGDAADPSAQPTVLCRTVTVCNLRGLHARAAARFVSLAERYGASVEVTRLSAGQPEGEAVSARAIMGLMMLGAGRGATLELRAEGWDAKEAIDALAALVEARFDEQE